MARLYIDSYGNRFPTDVLGPIRKAARTIV
jgi:hypothetical protein